MHDQRNVPLRVAIEGVLGGMAGALAVTALAAAGREVLFGQGRAGADQADAGGSAGQALSEGPAMPPDMNRVTATFVQKLATGIFGTSLSADQQYAAGTAWHLAYGGFWGMVYALVQSSVPVPRLVLAPIHGLGVWAIGAGWLVPKMKLMLPLSKQQPRTAAVVIAIHLVYSAVMALAFHLLRGGDEAADRLPR